MTDEFWVILARPLPSIQLFRQRSYKSIIACATMPIIGNVGSDGVSLLGWSSHCFSKNEGEAWIHVFVLLPSTEVPWTSKQLKPRLPRIPFDIVEYVFVRLLTCLKRAVFLQPRRKLLLWRKRFPPNKALSTGYWFYLVVANSKSLSCSVITIGLKHQIIFEGVT